MIQLMDNTVNVPGFTGSGYRIDGGELIGKTGTAQIASENGGGYLQGTEDIISSFAGLYPKSNPQVLIYASVKRPSWGSQKPISNAVKEIVRNISKYYGNSDSVTSSIEIKDYTVPSFINKKVDTAKSQLESKGIRVQVLGEGNKVIKQTPDENDVITNQDTVYLITNDSNIKVPNVTGLSSKVASNLLTKLGLTVHLDGVGYVNTQSLGEGSDIAPGTEIILECSPRFAAE